MRMNSASGSEFGGECWHVTEALAQSLSTTIPLLEDKKQHQQRLFQAHHAYHSSAALATAAAAKTAKTLGKMAHHAGKSGQYMKQISMPALMGTKGAGSTGGTTVFSSGEQFL